MLYKDINKRYTEIVMEYMAKGYYINTYSQRGSQGEIAKVDVTDGKKIIRILIETFSRFETGVDGIRIMVGRVPDDERVQPNGTDTWGTIWNEHLEVITEEFFYQLGGTARNGDRCYGTYEEAVAAQQKRMERYHNRGTPYGPVEKALPEAAKQIALNFVKCQPRCKSTKLDDIEKVYSVTYRDGLKHYYVEAKGKKFKLG